MGRGARGYIVDESGEVQLGDVALQKRLTLTVTNLSVEAAELAVAGPDGTR